MKLLNHVSIIWLIYKIHKETCSITEIICLPTLLLVVEIISLIEVKDNIDIYIYTGLK